MTGLTATPTTECPECGGDSIMAATDVDGSEIVTECDLCRGDGVVSLAVAREYADDDDADRFWRGGWRR